MFERRGVERMAMFDINPEVVNTKIYGVPVYHINELYSFCKTNNVHIGVLTVPKEAAYEVTDTLIAAGVKGIWNFANMELKLDDPNVVVENIHLGDSLLALCYEIKTKNGKDD
jgi:redox-sensing transcriptional repressor